MGDALVSHGRRSTGDGDCRSLVWIRTYRTLVGARHLHIPVEYVLHVEGHQGVREGGHIQIGTTYEGRCEGTRYVH